jgi:guanosine-3',5'-bis(diphosphate) 3'-pyrophosphohydrolase
VVTGLLHDILEDTEVSADELREQFGSDIALAVEALTQDPSIRGYRRRKAALREQILAAGPEVAAVSLADKLAKLRKRTKRPPDRKLAHYAATLEGVERRYGRSCLSEQLREQLERWPAG